MDEAGKLYKTDHPITSAQTPHIPTPAKTKKRLMLLSIKAGIGPFIQKKQKNDIAVPTNKILKYCSLNLKTNRIWCIVHIAEHKQI
jgi:hypothetical protein